MNYNGKGAMSKSNLPKDGQGNFLRQTSQSVIKLFHIKYYKHIYITCHIRKPIKIIFTKKWVLFRGNFSFGEMSRPHLATKDGGWRNAGWQWKNWQVLDYTKSKRDYVTTLLPQF